MPIFEFRCTECGHVFEEYTRKRNLLGIECPKCNALATKEMSVSNFKVNGYNADNNYSGKPKTP